MWKLLNYPGVVCKQDRNFFSNIVNVMVSNIEQKHGKLSIQLWLVLFGWLKSDLKRCLKATSLCCQRARYYYLLISLRKFDKSEHIFNLQPTCNRFSIFKSCIKIRIKQLSVFVANWQHKDLGKFTWQQIKMVAKESMK